MRPTLVLGAVAGVIVAAGVGLLFASSHVTWHVHVTAASAVRGLASSSEPADALYAATNRGVLESPDGGRTWRLPESDTGPRGLYALAVDRHSPRVLYAGGESGLFERHHDGTWMSVTPPGFARRTMVEAVAVDPAAPGLVYVAVARLGVLRSENAGREWSLGTTGLTSLELSALAIDTAHPGNLYVATAGAGVFASADRGDSWRAINDGLDHLTVRALVLAPHGTVLYAGTVGGGIYRRRSSENRWEPASDGLAHRIVWALAVDPLDPATVYAGVSGAGVYWSRSGGVSWSRLTPGWHESVWALQVDPRDRRTLHVGTASGSIARGTVTPLVRLAAALGLDVGFRTQGD